MEVIDMTAKRTDLPLNEIIQMYIEGSTLRQLAKAYVVSPKVLLRSFKEAGVSKPRRKTLPDQDIIQLYQAGHSLDALGRRYGVADNVIKRRLIEQAIPLRTQSEQEREKWRQMSPEQRQRQVGAAHAANKGSARDAAVLRQKAQTLQRQGRMQPLEAQVHHWLHDRGILTIPQQAIGPYNCDLGAFPVAVEIFGGNWHWYGKHAAGLLKRLHYILYQGWSVIAIHVNQMYRPLLPAAADEVATYIQLVRSNPTLIGEYRMIRGTGEFVAALRPESDDFANILTITRPLYT